MRPFIGRVDACSGVRFAGSGTTDAAGATTSCDCAPPSGRRGPTTAITGSPTSNRLTPAPIDSIAPAASQPGTQGGGTSWIPRVRNPMSDGFTAAAADGDPDLAGAGLADVALDQAEHLRPARLHDPDR